MRRNRQCRRTDQSHWSDERNCSFVPLGCGGSRAASLSNLPVGTGEVRRKAEVFGETGKAEMFGETDDTTSALGGGQYLVALH